MWIVLPIAQASEHALLRMTLVALKGRMEALVSHYGASKIRSSSSPMLKVSCCMFT